MLVKTTNYESAWRIYIAFRDNTTFAQMPENISLESHTGCMLWAFIVLLSLMFRNVSEMKMSLCATQCLMLYGFGHGHPTFASTII